MTRRDILMCLRAGKQSGHLKKHLLAMTDEELIAEAERIFNTARSGQTYDPEEETSLPEWWKCT